MLSDKQPESVEANRDLLQRVNSFLYQRGYALHHTLEISVERGVVVVQGDVPTYYLRQVAVECIKRIAGVIQVVDLIEVADEPRQRHPTGNSSDGQESSAVSTRQRADCKPRSHYDRRHPISSTEG